MIALLAARRVIERNYRAYKRQWYVFASGFAEPLLYLLSIGIGVGELVGKVPGPGGQLVGYRDYVAPGMLAAAAMTGAIFDTTFNFFIKLKYQGVYDAMLATPLSPGEVAIGEVGWALLRGAMYAAAFVVAMVLFGLVHSWWALLAVPAAVLIGFAFAGVGLGASGYMRSWTDFDLVNLAVTPMFLFSGTFFPLGRYPGWLQAVVRCTPLYQGVALERSLVFGELDVTTALHALYLVGLGLLGARIASRRLSRLLTA
ncbi:MAG: type transporter [Actinomycetia bacterium]|nr:type transporter [Actinomycetes bacterium]